ncbi:hypothetical protein [Halomicronema sp. CCY15110]|uniref:hypothetical protein n=1 Tax=Halomicronema sp. CCY15110 TaxID=2767773 RepID=UPI00194E1E6F|nr:hypothetical protein [Halomicronema sp. CCY15110]
MTNTVKERLQPEFAKAKQDSQQRAARISEILKSAASMTFAEIKGGSTELNTFTRRSVAELLEELNEVPVESLDEVPVNDRETQVSTEVAEPAAPPSAPTWKDLITIALQLVRDRKGNWLQQFKAHLNKNAEKFDGDMTDDYGDRYLKVKNVVQTIATWLTKTHSPATTTETASESRPVSIEVMDDEPAATETQPAQ